MEESQRFYIEEAKKIVEQKAKEKGAPLTCCVNTFGCQMNARDSEKLTGVLEEVGYQLIESELADFVIYNTCTVRENANNKVYGRLGYLNGYKRKNPNMIIALCGCMMQEEQVLDKIKRSYPFVNLIFGTHNIFEFPKLLLLTLNQKKMVVDIWKESNEIQEELPIVRKYAYKSGVNIMYGCNNFCSYCIVPYVRGREKSRKPEDILAEIRHLASEGVIEIMLLGQNVNSYGKELDTTINFAQLLRQVEEIDGIIRIRFMTSHPKDLSQELIDVIAQSKKICHHIHLPIQSGSTEILEKMNRRYSKDDYLKLVERIRSSIPDIAITTDIIIGFPGETEEDFLETMDVVERVGFDSAFTFVYSRRTGTPAAVMENQVEPEVVKDRFDRLLIKVHECTAKKAELLTGKELPVLVESKNEQDDHLLTGRLANNSVVHFPGDETLIGTIITVRLVTCKGFYYLGEHIS
ncbi:MAG: tRNA (N6-isopentenyl adenosine(37)-C2)-methylthiotransferase MiaB [Lachnospiraceae bacterium]